MGLPNRTYIIAEIGINHNGSLELAKQLIRAAKDCGADAVKFQKRTVDLVYTPAELAAPRESPFGSTNGDLKRGLEFGKAEYDEIAGVCSKTDIDWSASCWDTESVTFMDQYDIPWLKIPSALLTNQTILNAHLDTKRPLLLSTGMSTIEEIDQAVIALQEADLTVMHCHSAYPSPLEEVNLSCIPMFKKRYAWCDVGYSSHTVSPWPCLMAAVYGAQVIEAHLTLDRSMFGSDQAASLEPAAFKKLVEEIRTWERCKGDGVKRCWPSEEPAKRKLRR